MFPFDAPRKTQWNIWFPDIFKEDLKREHFKNLVGQITFQSQQYKYYNS